MKSNLYLENQFPVRARCCEGFIQWRVEKPVLELNPMRDITVTPDGPINRRYLACETCGNEIWLSKPGSNEPFNPFREVYPECI